ncbi:MAG: hypothetical protein ACSLFM_07865 [Tepidiformaceae bacterium]
MPQHSPVTLDDEWFSGTDKTLEFTVVDADSVAVNITGWALQWVLTLKDSRTVMLTKTVGSGITITSGAAGILQVAVADTDTNDFATGRTALYDYELRRTDAGNEDVLAYGTVVLRPGKVTS